MKKTIKLTENQLKEMIDDVTNKFYGGKPTSYPSGEQWIGESGDSDLLNTGDYRLWTRDKMIDWLDVVGVIRLYNKGFYDDWSDEELRNQIEVEISDRLANEPITEDTEDWKDVEYRDLLNTGEYRLWNKEKMIDWLINSDLDNIEEKFCSSGYSEELYSLLRYGWQGYERYPNEELKTKVEEKLTYLISGNE